jgi:hypothetical protein
VIFEHVQLSWCREKFVDYHKNNNIKNKKSRGQGGLWWNFEIVKLETTAKWTININVILLWNCTIKTCIILLGNCISCLRWNNTNDYSHERCQWSQQSHIDICCLPIFFQGLTLWTHIFFRQLSPNYWINLFGWFICQIFNILDILVFFYHNHIYLSKSKKNWEKCFWVSFINLTT